jgi:hypothetical protein
LAEVSGVVRTKIDQQRRHPRLDRRRVEHGHLAAPAVQPALDLHELAPGQFVGAGPVQQQRVRIGGDDGGGGVRDDCRESLTGWASAPRLLRPPRTPVQGLPELRGRVDRGAIDVEQFGAQGAMTRWAISAACGSQLGVAFQAGGQAVQVAGLHGLPEGAVGVHAGLLGWRQRQRPPGELARRLRLGEGDRVAQQLEDLQPFARRDGVAVEQVDLAQQQGLRWAGLASGCAASQSRQPRALGRPAAARLPRSAD